jgi:hypothetical protein
LASIGAVPGFTSIRPNAVTDAPSLFREETPAAPLRFRREDLLSFVPDYAAKGFSGAANAEPKGVRFIVRKARKS